MTLKRTRFWFLISLLSMSLAGCASDNKRTKEGAAAGAVVGGVAGTATKGAKGGAIGAAVGAAAGGAIGAYLDRRAKELSKVVQTEKTENGLLITLRNDLLFDFDKATLRSNAEQTLSDLADILKKYPQDDLRIAGYTDHTGPESYNQKLSEARAESVKDYLAQQGVEQQRLAAVGLGETGQEADTSEGRQKNRKVEIFVDVQPPQQQ